MTFSPIPSEPPVRSEAGFVVGAVVSMVAAVATYYLVVGVVAWLAPLVATAFGSNIWVQGSEMDAVGLPFVWFVFYAPPAAAYFFVARLSMRALARRAGSHGGDLRLPLVVFIVMQVALLVWAPILSPFSFVFGGGLPATF